MHRLRLAEDNELTITLTPQDCRNILKEIEELVKTASGYAKHLADIKEMLGERREEPVAEKEVKPVKKAKRTKKAEVKTKGRRVAKAAYAEVVLRELLEDPPYSMVEFIEEALKRGLTNNSVDRYFKLPPGTAKGISERGARILKRVAERAILAVPQMERQLRAISIKPRGGEPLKPVKAGDMAGSERFTILNKVLNGCGKKALPDRISEAAKQMKLSIHDLAEAVGVPPQALARYVVGDNVSAKARDWIETVFSGTYGYDA